MDDAGAAQNGHPAAEFDVTEDEVTCRQFVELVTDYFEGALDARSLARVEEHLVMCDWCVTYVEQLDATIDALAQLSDPVVLDPPTQALAALRARTEA